MSSYEKWRKQWLAGGRSKAEREEDDYSDLMTTRGCYGYDDGYRLIKRDGRVVVKWRPEW